VVNKRYIYRNFNWFPVLFYGDRTCFNHIYLRISRIILRWP